MADAPRSHRAAQVAWAFYDWAAQPFFTVVVTFIFGPYFQNFIAPNPTTGQAWWGYGSAVAGLILALTAPFLGAMVDSGAPRLRWLFWTMVLMSLGMAVTWFAVPGASHLAVFILAGVVLASLGAEYGILITNAMMPDLATPDQMGRLSGWGWAVGYLGGLFLLIFILLAFALPDTPLWGLDKQAHEPDRIVGPFAILWLWIFGTPLLLLAPHHNTETRTSFSVAWHNLKTLAGAWRGYKNVALYLLARMLYYDGVTAVYIFGGLYAAGTFGWDITQLGIFGILLIIAGAIGTFLGGIVDDRIGSKKTILLSLIGIIVCMTGILSVQLDQVLFFLSVPVIDNPPLFGTLPQQIMLGFGAGIGIFLGPVQSASRTMMARISPPEKMTTFFGLYSLTGRATAFVAPLIVALVTDAVGSRRIGLASILVLMAIGFLLLLKVSESPSDGNGASR